MTPDAIEKLVQKKVEEILAKHQHNARHDLKGGDRDGI